MLTAIERTRLREMLLAKFNEKLRENYMTWWKFPPENSNYISTANKSKCVRSNQ